MFPVLFSFGKIAISSFGLFLALGFGLGIFLIWRLSRAWDLDEEKILDLTLITFLGGLIGARIYFALEHPNLFAQNLLNILVFYKTPGFSFWGAILGGWLALFFASRRKKIDFAQIGDIAAIGFLGSLIFTSLGCFFGGCNVGIPSKAFFAVNMVGAVGKRFPVQLLEAVLFIWALLTLWSKATHFHTRGKILSLSLIYIGIIKFITENFRQNHTQGKILAVVLIYLGISMMYKFTKRSPINDLKSIYKGILGFFTDPLKRKAFFVGFSKYWYNRRASLLWKLRNFKKTLRRLNVRFS